MVQPQKVLEEEREKYIELRYTYEILDRIDIDFNKKKNNGNGESK